MTAEPSGWSRRSGQGAVLSGLVGAGCAWTGGPRHRGRGSADGRGTGAAAPAAIRSMPSACSALVRGRLSVRFQIRRWKRGGGFLRTGAFGAAPRAASVRGSPAMPLGACGRTLPGGKGGGGVQPGAEEGALTHRRASPPTTPTIEDAPPGGWRGPRREAGVDSRACPRTRGGAAALRGALPGGAARRQGQRTGVQGVDQGHGTAHRGGAHAQGRGFDPAAPAPGGESVLGHRGAAGR